MIRGKCVLGRGLGPSSRKVLVCLYPSTPICQCLLAGKGLLYAKLQLEKLWGEV